MKKLEKMLEDAIIGSLLLVEQKDLKKLLNYLNDKTFKDAHNAKIYNVISKTKNNDIIKIANLLKIRNTKVVLAKRINACPVADNALEYIKRLAIERTFNFKMKVEI